MNQSQLRQVVEEVKMKSMLSLVGSVNSSEEKTTPYHVPTTHPSKPSTEVKNPEAAVEEASKLPDKVEPEHKDSHKVC